MIYPRAEEFTIDYSGEALPDTFIKQATDANFSQAFPKYGANELLMQCINYAQRTLLVACNNLQEESLLAGLRAKADSGVRIYLLLGSESENRRAIETLSGRCLIRAGVAQQGALLLADHATNKPQALLLSSGKPCTADAGEAWGMQLDSSQIEDNFRSFCQLFWQSASKEYLKQNSPQKSSNHPDGDIITNHSYNLPGDLGTSLEHVRENLTAMSGAHFQSGSAKWLLSATDLEAVDPKHLARSGVAITEEANIPAVLLSSHGYYLLPDVIDKASAHWCLRLSKAQSQQLSEIFSKSMRDSAWQYAEQSLLGDLADAQELRWGDEPHEIVTIRATRSQDLGSIEAADIDEFLAGDVQALCSNQLQLDRQNLAHEIRYRVTVNPPYLPEAASKDKDPLYKKWEEVDTKYQATIADLKERQAKISRRNEELGNKFKKYLAKFKLGSEHSSKEIASDLESLQAASITKSTRGQRHQYFERLNDLAKKVSKLEGELKLKSEEAKQHEQWDATKQRLEDELLQAERNLQEKKTLLEQKQNARKNSSDNKKALKKLGRDVKDARRSYEAAVSDIAGRETKLKQHGDVFTFQSKGTDYHLAKELGIKDDNNYRAKLDIKDLPSEELPECGTLYSHKNKRYLEIERKDQIDSARKDAERLRAKIVCNKD